MQDGPDPAVPDACRRPDGDGPQDPPAEFRRDPPVALDVAGGLEACGPFRVAHPARAAGVPGAGKRLLRLRRRDGAPVPATLRPGRDLPVAGVGGVILPEGPARCHEGAGVCLWGRFGAGESDGSSIWWQGGRKAAPLAKRKENAMTCPTTPSGGETSTVHAALQVSGTGWILAVGDPADASRTGLHRLAPHDVDGPPAKPVRARERAAAASGGDVRVMPVHGAGYGGFWLARRLEGEDLGVVVRHPAGPGVVRRGRKGRTDRTGARGMVRALRAWDGGDRDAMSPVRVPTVAEEEGRRLPPRRGRPVKERLRLAGAVAGLLRPRGIPPGDPARKGYRARPGGMRTACGAGLPPGRGRCRGRAARWTTPGARQGRRPVQYVSARDGRAGGRGIVALPGKLPGAPVRFATTGLAHGGAVLSKAPA